MAEAPDNKEDPYEKYEWQGLVRGTILTTTTRKLFGYIQLVDQKAMGLILLNSAIVPLAMNWVAQEDLQLPATIAVITGVICILLAIWCIFPKRGKASKPNGDINLLHFTDIGNLSEEEYLERMYPVYNDRGLLAQTVMQDIHDVSSRVLIPKFKLLKASYILFFFGNLIAVAAFLYSIWST